MEKPRSTYKIIQVKLRTNCQNTEGALLWKAEICNVVRYNQETGMAQVESRGIKCWVNRSQYKVHLRVRKETNARK